MVNAIVQVFLGWLVLWDFRAVRQWDLPQLLISTVRFALHRDADGYRASNPMLLVDQERNGQIRPAQITFDYDDKT